MARIKWSIAGKCERPVYREIMTRGTGLDPEAPSWLKAAMLEGKDASSMMLIELDTRCRKCVPCLKARAGLWSIRSRAEIQASARTWFGTLTLRPEEQHRLVSQARHRLRKQAVDFDALPEDKQFAERHREASRDLTLYLKRLRKESGAKLRYILVAERHKSGLPHYHILIHECQVGRPVLHRTLTGQWHLGFSNFKLVEDNDPRAAAYVCKYLAKCADARVRASARYGEELSQYSPLNDLGHKRGNSL